MKSFICFLAAFINCCYAFSQQSVYDCYTPTTVTQAQISASSGSVFNKKCILFSQSQSYNFNGSSQLDINASSSITLEPGFVSGVFNTNGFMELNIAQEQNLNIVSINQQNLNSIPKLEKFELGIQLPASIQTKVDNFLQELQLPQTEKLNPFLEWNLRVYAELIHIPSSYTTSAEAFYYRNFERNTLTNSWTDLGTNYPFRIRIAPEQLGEWSCTIKVLVNNTLIHTSLPFNFNVVSSSNLGFVKKHTNGKNFMRNGNPLYALGQNVAWPKFFSDGVCNVSDWEDYLGNISDYADLGGKYIRVLTHPKSMDIEWEKLGNYYNRLHFATEMDNLLELAKQKDLLIHFNLMMHQQVMNVADYCSFEWDFSSYFPTNNPECTWGEPVTYQPYAYRTELGLTNAVELFTNQTALDYLKQRTRYLISRYGYSTNIYLFELLSEAFHTGTDYQAVFTCSDTDGNGTIDQWDCDAIDGTKIEPYHTNTTVKAAVYNYHNQLSTYIKNTLDHKQHLIGVDYGFGFNLPNVNPYYPFENDVNKGWPDLSYLLPTVDVIGLNMYIPYSDKLFTNSSIPIENEIQNLRVNFNKLIMFSEFGHGDLTDECSLGNAYKVDVKTGPFSGTAGMNMWHGIMPSNTANYNDLISSKDFLNNYISNRVFQSDWSHYSYILSPVDPQNKELQMYISSNKSCAIGYVKNRTSNLYTVNNGEYPCSSLTQTYNTLQDLIGYVEIEGLKPNRDYQIRWFNYNSNGASNDFYFEDCISTNLNGKVVIWTPLLTGINNPINWFQIDQINCNNLSENLAKSYSDSIPSLSSYSNDSFIYPNPFYNEINIFSNKKIQNIKIHSNQGQLIKEFYFSGLNNEEKILLDYFSSGLYLIILNDETRFKISKN